MNAILLGAASFGAFVAILTGDPSEQGTSISAQNVSIETAAGDRGEMKRMTLVHPNSGEVTKVSVISFAD